MLKHLPLPCFLPGSSAAGEEEVDYPKVVEGLLSDY